MPRAARGAITNAAVPLFADPLERAAALTRRRRWSMRKSNLGKSNQDLPLEDF